MAEKILLNDLLRIDENSEDYKNGKIALCTGWHGKDSPIKLWLERDDRQNKFGMDYCFNAKSEKQTRFWEGNIIICSALLPSRNFLLTSICRVTKTGNPSEREPIEEYRKYFGRVVFKCDNKSQRYQYHLSTMLDRCIVVEILENEYGGEPWCGYDNLCVNMGTLMDYLTKKSMGKEWRRALSDVKAVYCLNNHDEGKVYIGSAYNDNGCLLKRWEDYFKTIDGGDKDLIELRKEHDDKYFLDNFYFSILEVFDKKTNDNTIIKREYHWMKVFNSTNKKCGYNNK